MSVVSWVSIHKLIEIVIDFTEGRTVLAALSRLNWQWRTIFLQWPDTELWRRIIVAIHRPTAMQWKLVQRFLPQCARERPPLAFTDVCPSKSDTDRTLHVFVVTPSYKLLSWLADVPITASVSTVVYRATRAVGYGGHSQRVVFCGQQIHGADSTIAELRAAGRKHASRTEVILVLPDVQLPDTTADDPPEQRFVPFDSLDNLRQSHSDPTLAA
jgi:hypothetical protein